MKYFDQLQIHFDPSVETFEKLTAILGVSPNDNVSDFPDYIPSCWTYEVIDDNPNEYFDFINVFLELIEPKYEDLAKLNTPTTVTERGKTLSLPCKGYCNLPR